MWNLKKEKKERKEKNGKSSMWRNFVFFRFPQFFRFVFRFFVLEKCRFQKRLCFPFFSQLSTVTPDSDHTDHTIQPIQDQKKHQKSFSRRFQVDFCDFHFGENVQVDFIRFISCILL